jgi:hypothetical protein
MFTVPLNVPPLAVIPLLNVAEELNVADELNVAGVSGPIVKALGEEKVIPVSPVSQSVSMAMSKAPSE